MKVYKHPEAFGTLRSLYWRLRSARRFDGALHRKLYRGIRAERDRLALEGWSSEHLRLYCRYLSNPSPQSPALHRLRTFEAMLADVGRIQSRAKFVDLADLEVVTDQVQLDLAQSHLAIR